MSAQGGRAGVCCHGPAPRLCHAHRPDGAGPLLYLLGWQYLNAGVKIAAILETTPRGRLRAALPHLGDFRRSP